MNILGNLGPEDSDLVYIVTQPLIAAFYVSTLFFFLLEKGGELITFFFL